MKKLSFVFLFSFIAFTASAQYGRPGYKLGSIQVITTTGGGTWTRPAGCRAIDFILIGGGGGGGGVTAAASQLAGAAGGGGGGYLRKWFENPASSYTIVVGAGGAGATAGANTGLNGNASTWVIGGTTYTANGGQGGLPMTTGTAVDISLGGAGAANSINGDVNFAGIAGDNGMRLSATIGKNGAGGPGPFGGGPAAVKAGQVAGTNATGYGSGGSGAFHVTTGTTSRAGGAGSQGVIIVYEYY